MLWMLDNQGGRRNLSDVDKITIASKKEAIIARKAAENLKTSTGGAEPPAFVEIDKGGTNQYEEGSRSIRRCGADEICRGKADLGRRGVAKHQKGATGQSSRRNSLYPQGRHGY